MNLRFILACGFLLWPTVVAAEHDYHQTVLESIFPAGGQRGTTVRVELVGAKASLKGADSIVIDGPAGITVSEVAANDKGVVQATFTIAEDAAVGRRMIRVRGGATGLTNFRWFFVGALPEHMEKQNNNSLDVAEPSQLPIVINGRVDPALDQDCFRFEARAGQKVVVAVLSHWLDAIGYDLTNMGFADLSLELLDTEGRVLAQAGDTLGNDPLIHFAVPRDGAYIARVSGMGFKGFAQAVYRLTIGEVPYPIALFPPGGRRGETVDVEFFGPNVPSGTRQSITIDDDPFPVQYVSWLGDYPGIHELPLIRDDLPQSVQLQPTVDRQAAAAITLPVTIHGRFDAPSDDDWFRLPLDARQKVTFEIMAQRHLRAPVDTLVEIFNAAGERVAMNDDGALFGGECTHDFVPFDSRLEFTAPAAGEHFVRVSEQSGAVGERAVYRLSVHDTEPDFRLYQFPDAVPIWGPGSTAAFVVETHRMGDLQEDIEITVEGLPPGWTGSTITALGYEYRVPLRAAGQKSLLTITAPADAAVGTLADFHVVGRCRIGEREVMRTAQPLTLYMWQEPNHFRFSPRSRAVVAAPHPFRLWAESEEIRGRAGEQVEIPIRIETVGGEAPAALRVSVNRSVSSFLCAVGPQVPLAGAGPSYQVPLTIPNSYKLGRYSLTVADAWSSETRKGLPGPCTPLIRLIVTE